MTARPICEANDCQARAWNGGLCSFHALQQHYQNAERHALDPAHADRARAEHQARADELGLKLAEHQPEPEVETVTASVPGKLRKVRSPVS